MEKWNVHDVHGFYMIFKMKNWDVMELESPRCESWCWNIELQNWAMVGVNVGKYSSAMEHLGMEWKHWILQILPWRIEMSWSEESRPWVQEPPVRIEGFIGLWHLDHEGFGVEALNYHGGYTLFFWIGETMVIFAGCQTSIQRCSSSINPVIGHFAHKRHQTYSGKLTVCYWKLPLKSWVFPLKFVISHIYVKLPEGTYSGKRLHFAAEITMQNSWQNIHELSTGPFSIANCWSSPEGTVIRIQISTDLDLTWPGIIQWLPQINPRIFHSFPSNVMWITVTPSIPLVIQHNYEKSKFLMGKFTINGTCP